MTREPIIHALFFLLLSSFLFFISVIVPVIPLSYDEAWNYTNIVSRGPLYAVTNFPFANNHVFFSFLQTYAVPQKLLPYYPEATRVLNVAVGIALISFLYMFLIRLRHRHSPLLFTLTAAVCFFASPLVTPFFIVARGYLLGMALLFAGIYCLWKERHYSASLLFILSGWTVITYLYALPAVYAAALLMSRKKDRSRLMVSVILTGAGLYTLYKPILLTILTQGTLWNTASLFAFMSGQWRSLSYLSFLPYGMVGNIFFTGAYLLSIALLFHKRFFVLLNSAVAGYLITVIITSLTGIAHPPYERAGIFIPMVAGITMLAAALEKQSWKTYVLWLVLGANVAGGVYFFSTGLPGIRYMAPVPYPVSPAERILLREKKLPYLTLTRPEDEPFLTYFSMIYSLPVQTIQTEHPKPVPAINSQKQRKVFYFGMKQAPVPHILPTHPLYPFKRISQYAASKLVRFFTISKTPHIRHLLYLSDLTYAEAGALWKSGQFDAAVKALGRAEHDMTLAAGETRDALGIQGKNDAIIGDTLASVILHQRILVGIIGAGNEVYMNQVLDIISFSNRNLETVLSFAAE